MKKLVSVLLAAAVILNLAACGANPSSGAASAAPESKTEGTGSGPDNTADGGRIRICVVYSGSLGDKSYHDSCNMGALRAAEDFGVEVKSLEGSTAEEWEANLVAACEDNYDLIIGATSNIADYIRKHAPNYPDVRFAVIDTVVDLPNVESITFAQSQGSFLAGAAAAMFTGKTDIDGVNDEAIIGWVGGMDIPVLHDFYIGYEQGAKYINPDIRIFQAFSGSWNDPLKGKELTLAQYEQGADIVMAVASATGNGVLEAARESGKYAIGVDLNQDNEQPGHVLTSMLKRVDNACYLVIESVVIDDFQGGTTKYLSLAEGGVSLTDFSVMREALAEQFPEDIVTECEIIAEKIISGEIIVENYEGFGPQ